jgi:hypothetical protein
MAFKVRFTGSKKPTDFDTDDVYDFHDGGVLSITFANEAKWTEYHAPQRWEQVTAEPDHKPGRTGGSPPLLDTIGSDTIGP